MTQAKGETATEYLRRIADNFRHESNGLLCDLPTIAACVEFFELWSTYGTDFLVGIHEGIMDGEDPKPLQDFIAKHKLPKSRWLPREVMTEHRKKKTS